MVSIDADKVGKPPRELEAVVGEWYVAEESGDNVRSVLREAIPSRERSRNPELCHRSTPYARSALHFLAAEGFD